MGRSILGWGADVPSPVCRFVSRECCCVLSQGKLLMPNLPLGWVCAWLAAQWSGCPSHILFQSRIRCWRLRLGRMRRQYRDEGYHPRAEVCGQSAFSFFMTSPQLLGLFVRKPRSLAKKEMFRHFCSFISCLRTLCCCVVQLTGSSWNRQIYFKVGYFSNPENVYCLSVFVTASSGLQPGQFDQTKQRAGVTDGETNPDMSTC